MGTLFGLGLKERVTLRTTVLNTLTDGTLFGLNSLKVVRPSVFVVSIPSTDGHPLRTSPLGWSSLALAHVSIPSLMGPSSDVSTALAALTAASRLNTLTEWAPSSDSGYESAPQ